MIEAAFPQLQQGFYDILFGMIKDKSNGFTDERFRDSVNHVIKTCKYPQPTIAQFIGYDKTMNIFTYDQLLDKSNTDKNVFEKYKPIQFPTERNLMWVAKNDVERFNLKV